MKFCRQPNGRFLKYSNVTDTIERVNISSGVDLLAEVIEAMAYDIAERYQSVVEMKPGDYFDDVLHLKPRNSSRSRNKWLGLFTMCGADKEQLKAVAKRIDREIEDLKDEITELEHRDTRCGDMQDEDEDEIVRRIDACKSEIRALSESADDGRNNVDTEGED